MPRVERLSEFNRNQSAFINELHKSGQPIYLTHNGSASIVVMDADAFDRQMSYRARAYANEMRVYDHLMEGYADVIDGKVADADAVETEILSFKGWNA